MPLSDTNTDPGYICGRLTAAYELIAEQIGRELPLNDITLSATNPIHTLPRLRVGLVSQALARLRVNRPQEVSRVEKYLSELAEHLDAFPRSLTPEERACYVLGYEHQKAVGLPF